jgi:hypothetical protein
MGDCTDPGEVFVIIDGGMYEAEDGGRLPTGFADVTWSSRTDRVEPSGGQSEDVVRRDPVPVVELADRVLSIPPRGADSGPHAPT